MNIDELTRARDDWHAIERLHMSQKVSAAALWSAIWAPRFLKMLDNQPTPTNLNPVALQPLYQAADMAMTALMAADGGNPMNETGWQSEEYLEPWLALREARKLADDPNYVAKPIEQLIAEAEAEMNHDS